MKSVRYQILEHLDNQVRNKFSKRVRGQVSAQIWLHVNIIDGQIYNQVWNQMYSESIKQYRLI
jgi:hypothetical protein